jgi:Tol biopolymer transport system component
MRDPYTSGSSFYPSLSADGRYVAFISEGSNLVDGDRNGARDIFVHDTQAHTTIRASVANTAQLESNGESAAPQISADGRYVIFQSDATNLVGGDTNRLTDIFVRDLQAHTTVRVSVADNGDQTNARSVWTTISGDGRYVAFSSEASNLVGGDANGTYDIFVRGPLR